MGKTLDLGQRIELQPADVHCCDISLGLYRRDVDDVPQFVVHTYSSTDQARQRVAFITKALMVMLGLEGAPSGGGWLRFPCRTNHERALKRAFLDLCKLETDAALTPKPLTVFDKKANGDLTAQSLGDGVYEIQCEEGLEAGPRRTAAVAAGFAKLCEMEPAVDDDRRVAFACRTAHDAMMGMLMFRAQNVRAAMQEEQMAASRGMLAAPSQQK